MVFVDTDTPILSYLIYEREAFFAGGEVVGIELKKEDGFHLRIDRFPRFFLEETVTVWINYPHNPTGVVTPLPYLEEVYGIYREYRIILCSNECYTEIYFEEPPHSAILSR